MGFVDFFRRQRRQSRVGKESELQSLRNRRHSMHIPPNSEDSEEWLYVRASQDIPRQRPPPSIPQITKPCELQPTNDPDQFAKQKELQSMQDRPSSSLPRKDSVRHSLDTATARAGGGFEDNNKTQQGLRRRKSTLSRYFSMSNLRNSIRGGNGHAPSPSMPNVMDTVVMPKAPPPPLLYNSTSGLKTIKSRPSLYLPKLDLELSNSPEILKNFSQDIPPLPLLPTTGSKDKPKDTNSILPQQRSRNRTDSKKYSISWAEPTKEMEQLRNSTKGKDHIRSNPQNGPQHSDNSGYLLDSFNENVCSKNNDTNAHTGIATTASKINATQNVFSGYSNRREHTTSSDHNKPSQMGGHAQVVSNSSSFQSGVSLYGPKREQTNNSTYEDPEYTLPAALSETLNLELGIFRFSHEDSLHSVSPHHVTKSDDDADTAVATCSHKLPVDLGGGTDTPTLLRNSSSRALKLSSKSVGDFKSYRKELSPSEQSTIPFPAFSPSISNPGQDSTAFSVKDNISNSRDPLTLFTDLRRRLSTHTLGQTPKKTEETVSTPIKDMATRTSYLGLDLYLSDFDYREFVAKDFDKFAEDTVTTTTNKTSNGFGAEFTPKVQGQRDLRLSVDSDDYSESDSSSDSSDGDLSEEEEDVYSNPYSRSTTEHLQTSSRKTSSKPVPLTRKEVARKALEDELRAKEEAKRNEEQRTRRRELIKQRLAFERMKERHKRTIQEGSQVPAPGPTSLNTPISSQNGPMMPQPQLHMPMVNNSNSRSPSIKETTVGALVNSSGIASSMVAPSPLPMVQNPSSPHHMENPFVNNSAVSRSSAPFKQAKKGADSRQNRVSPVPRTLQIVHPHFQPHQQPKIIHNLMNQHSRTPSETFSPTSAATQSVSEAQQQSHTSSPSAQMGSTASSGSANQRMMGASQAHQTPGSKSPVPQAVVVPSSPSVKPPQHERISSFSTSSSFDSVSPRLSSDTDATRTQQQYNKHSALSMAGPTKLPDNASIDNTSVRLPSPRSASTTSTTSYDSSQDTNGSTAKRVRFRETVSVVFNSRTCSSNAISRECSDSENNDDDDKSFEDRITRPSSAVMIPSAVHYPSSFVIDSSDDDSEDDDVVDGAFGQVSHLGADDDSVFDGQGEQGRGFHSIELERAKTSTRKSFRESCISGWRHIVEKQPLRDREAEWQRALKLQKERRLQERELLKQSGQLGDSEDSEDDQNIYATSYHQKRPSSVASVRNSSFQLMYETNIQVENGHYPTPNHNAQHGSANFSKSIPRVSTPTGITLSTALSRQQQQQGGTSSSTPSDTGSLTPPTHDGIQNLRLGGGNRGIEQKNGEYFPTVQTKHISAGISANHLSSEETTPVTNEQPKYHFSGVKADPSRISTDISDDDDDELPLSMLTVSSSSSNSHSDYKPTSPSVISEIKPQSPQKVSKFRWIGGRDKPKRSNSITSSPQYSTATNVVSDKGNTNPSISNTINSPPTSSHSTRSGRKMFGAFPRVFGIKSA
ncbi:hypothetical protein H4219_001656 [Mycoemilia scoparia]|uniref:Uncharacterized protein n=1 Tax=Mycoemilia scoparia TaxID=417184 RepID=A0A9W8DQ56_9FUNG|nr:hypothetical protein H4219_001656 [Mycoemilia scoparia]